MALIPVQRLLLNLEIHELMKDNDVAQMYMKSTFCVYVNFIVYFPYVITCTPTLLWSFYPFISISRSQTQTSVSITIVIAYQYYTGISISNVVKKNLAAAQLKNHTVYSSPPNG